LDEVGGTADDTAANAIRVTHWLEDIMGRTTVFIVPWGPTYAAVRFSLGIRRYGAGVWNDTGPLVGGFVIDCQ
jgi:hypothetical protein